MVDRWIKRRAHTRRIRSGRQVPVAAAWIPSFEKGKVKQNYRRSCPSCGALVLTVRMPRGGWGHFNGAPGLGKIKHPCMYLGQGLGRRRAIDMDDLFDAIS